MSRIYLVNGSSGEYDDYFTWTVKAFRDKTAAECFVLDIEKWIENSIQPKKKQWDRPYLKEGITEDQNPFDPEMYWSYTGPSYSVSELELVE